MLRMHRLVGERAGRVLHVEAGGTERLDRGGDLGGDRFG